MKINLNPSFEGGEDLRVVKKKGQNLISSCSEDLIGNPPLKGQLTQVIMRLHLIVLLFGLGLSQVAAYTFAQQITLHTKSSTLERILKEVEKQSGYSFFYKKAEVVPVRNISVDIKQMSLQQALDKILEKADFSYDIFENTVVLKKNPLSAARKNINKQEKLIEVYVLQQFVKGKVLNEEGEAMAGVSLKVKSSPNSVVVTNANGEFALPVTALNEIIVVSYVGYKSHEFKASLGNPIVIRLNKQEQKVEEVIITGMMERKKETFTGATSSFTGDELKMIGNTNVIQSLRTLDPSFLLMENNTVGSNLNVMPTIELRGQTSISTEGIRDEFSNDPNQPLFILDGFETTLQNIVDLDINRIASVTILKDAASTAIYGSRASNGVVVIETVRPKAGEIVVNYTTDGNVQFADLSGYNMMNAAEKLEFERLSGRYTIHYRNDSPDRQMYLDSLYSKRLQDVLRGVDSYWLSDPLQTSFSQRHSLMINGGDGALTYGVGGDYKSANGVMIGSARDTWGARFKAGYQGSKLRINNNLYLSGVNSEESPYGQFSTWANTNPYFEKQGSTERYLAAVRPYEYSTSVEYIDNPFYAAALGNFDRTGSFEITNNLQVRYDLSNVLRLESSLQITNNRSKTEQFVSPLDNSFVETAVLQRGALNSNSQNLFSYTANVGLQYGKSFGNHQINAHLRTEFSDKTITNAGFLAIGFPTASNGNARFAYGYETDGRPESSKAISRRNSIISSFNYSYDQRYNADVSFTYDGSTSFGNQNLYSPFYSVGASWNLHKEHFLENADWVELLRLRGNVGVTGNQNFSAFTSVSTYTYKTNFNYSGQGVSLASLGNPNLEWQNSIQTSLGLDATLFQSRLNVQLNAYRKLTDPLVVAITLPPSTALDNYPINAGTLTVDGLEAIIRYSPIYRPQDRVVWSIGFTGSTNKQIYNGFNNILENLNDNLRESQSLVKYRDGGDPDDLWAVPSLGIDPMTGLELFLKKDGTYTYQYDSDDEIVVGNSRPSLQGVVSSNLSYKGFTANLSFRYIANQDIFNTALFDKVENISMSQLIKYNQDKRALYDRWQQAGDQASFRRIQLTDYYQAGDNITGFDDSTPISSRFVQTENTLTLESASLGYELRNSTWMAKARLSNLRFTAYMNDIFRISTIRRERGIDYPYARTVSFSLSANIL